MTRLDQPPRWAILLGRVIGLSPRQVEWRWRRSNERREQRQGQPPSQGPAVERTRENPERGPAAAPTPTSELTPTATVHRPSSPTTTEVATPELENSEPVVCQHCNAVQRSTALRCLMCNKTMVSRLGRAARSFGMTLPTDISASMLIAAVCVAVYIMMLLRYPRNGLMGWTSLQLLSHGGLWHSNGFAEQLWRLGTACLLHIGVLHLVMNTIGLLQTGPMVEEVFGRGRTLLLFMVTGIVANVVSLLVMQHGVSAGASGAIMGLIGITAGVGHRMGRGRGHEIRNHMLRWGLYTMIYGFFIHADNAAHGGGFVVGALIGIAAPPRAVMRSRKSGSAAMLGALGMMLFIGCAALAFGTHRMPVSARPFFDPSAAHQVSTARFRNAVDAACTQRRTDPAAALRQFVDAIAATTPLTAEALDETCVFVLSVQARCGDFLRNGDTALTTDERADPQGRARDYFDAWCNSP